MIWLEGGRTKSMKNRLYPRELLACRMNLAGRCAGVGVRTLLALFVRRELLRDAPAGARHGDSMLASHTNAK